jgi:hypothetical protein
MLDDPRPHLKFNAPIDHIFSRAKDRYQRLCHRHRPAPRPENLYGLFEKEEVAVLQAARRWPPTVSDAAFITDRRPRPTAAAGVWKEAS